MHPFRFYFDKTLDYLYVEECKIRHPYSAMRRAKARLRSYANLFNRDMRKELIDENSICVNCKSNNRLTIDHIIPVSQGGLNVKSNVQILCCKCKMFHSNK
jgi:5-methylcytosine-specific restriction endonuclease McrA